jgi:F-type H+-transporting ATPase subunit epsilon
MRLKICVFTPDCVFYNEIINEGIIKTITGQLGILEGHVPLITILDIGPIIFRQDSNWTAIVLLGGIRCVQSRQITILVNAAEKVCSIEPDEVKKSLEIETNRLNQATNERDKIKAARAFKRARARYSAIRWKI